MKNFNPAGFLAFGEMNGAIRDSLNTQANKFMPKNTREKVLDYFQDALNDCNKLGLSLSAITAQKLMGTMLQPTKVSYKKVSELLQELSGRIYDEMESRLFLSIEPDKQTLFFGSALFDAKVNIAFPTAVIDIQEAGKCLALDRSTACVFHLMRVMEVGLRALEKSLNLSPSVNPNWQNILDKCTREQAKPLNQRAPEWQKNATFLAEATASLQSVKEAWRNPTMHIEKVYTEEQAGEIWNAVKGFMRHLSTKLTA